MAGIRFRAAWIAVASLLVAAPSACGGDGEGPSSSGGATFVYAGGGTSISVFRADLGTGALALEDAVAIGNDAYLAEIDGANRRAYVQTQLGLPVAILTLDIGSDGRLQRSGEHRLPHPGVEGVSQMQLHPTSPWLLISATGGASGLEDQLLPVGAGGALGAPQVIATEFYGFTWDRTGRFFYGLDGVAVSQFAFDPASGTLTPGEPPLSEGSTGHQFLALRDHPGGRWIYSIEEGAVGQFEVGAGGATLTARGYTPNPVPQEAMAWAWLVVHPTGRFLYAVGSFTATQVALVDVFAIDAGTGALTFVERELGGARHALTLQTFQATPLVGDLLLVGGRARAPGLEGQPALAVYRIDGASGGLTPVGDAPVPLRSMEGTVVNFVFASPGAR